MCNAQRCERSPDRIDTRAGSYKRKLHTKAGEIEIKMPKLRQQTFETAIIERCPSRFIRSPTPPDVRGVTSRCTWLIIRTYAWIAQLYFSAYSSNQLRYAL